MQRKTIGLILAGGLARRFGGGKALAHLQGKPLILWVKEALEPFCNEIWLSLRSPGQPEVSLKTHFERTIWDLFPGQGPLSGLLSALKGLSPKEILLAATCDQPLLQPRLLQKLIAAFLEGSYWVGFCLNQKGAPEPFPGLYHPEVKDSLERYLLSGRRSVRGWLEELPSEKILGFSFESWYPLDNQALSFLNVNFREDLSQLERLLN